VDVKDLGDPSSYYIHATVINDAGQVIGNFYTADGIEHAFVAGPHDFGMIDLNTLAVNLPEGKFIVAAYGINNHGQILVNVSEVPEPETYAMLIAGLALLGFMTHRREAVSPASNSLCNSFAAKFRGVEHHPGFGG
jgi:probable HAF family extracellular repeat protein